MTAALSTQAYLKPLLHSVKHSASAVVGLLLCVKGSPDEIVDAIPLHHHWVTLSPMTEAGLGIANEYAASSKPVLEICGVYSANAKLDDASISPTGEVLAKQIAGTTGRDALILVIDNKLLPTGKSPYQAFTCTATSSPSPSSAIPLDEALPGKTVGYLTQPKLVQSIGDFDEHLEHIGVGFLGQEIDLP